MPAYGLRRAFPDTPFLFLYRHPDEVMASHRRQRGPHMVPGLADAAMPRAAITPGPAHDLDGYCLGWLLREGAGVFFSSGGAFAGDPCAAVSPDGPDTATLLGYYEQLRRRTRA